MIPHNEIEEELLFHLEARVADLQQQGFDRQQAWRKARLELGAVGRYVEECREAQSSPVGASLRSAVANAARLLFRDRRYSFVSCLAVALGIGAATLSFTIGKRLLIDAMPYPDGDRIFNVRTVVPRLQEIHPNLPATSKVIGAARSACSSCEAILVMEGAVLQGKGAHPRWSGLRVSDGFEAITGAQAQRGRMFIASDYAAGAPAVAMLTAAGWREKFGSDDSVIGRMIDLDGVKTRITGVLGDGLTLPRGEQLGEMVTLGTNRADLVLPLRPTRTNAPAEEDFQWAMLVKLYRGASIDIAGREILSQLQKTPLTDAGDVRPLLVPLRDQLVQPSRKAMILWMQAAGILLLVVALNFANLELLRLGASLRELAIRSALGATRETLMLDAMKQVSLIVLVAGVPGAGIAWLGLRALEQWHPLFLPGADQMQPDFAVWCIAVAGVMVAGWCGIGLWFRNVAENDEAGMRQQRSSPVLLFSCIALSVALGSVALALDRQYHRWFDAKHGFDAKALWTFCARLPEGAKPTDFVQRREALRHRLQAVLPVAAIGTTNRIPLQGEATIDPIRVEGRDRPGPMAAWRIVGAGYFEAAGTRLLRGSNFDHATRSSAAVIVSERVAREVFPAGDALGSRLIVSTPGGVIRAPIVGIAENARSKNLDGNPPLLVYVSDMAFSSHEAFFLVRMKESRANPGDLIRHEVHQAGLLMPYDRVLPMAGVMNEVATPHRLPVIWFMLAAGVGLLANCLGVFSLVHFEANRRVLELGVCIAMGATRRQAAMRLLRAMIGPIASGLAVGAVLAVAGLASLDLLLPPNRAVWKGVAGVAITAALAALVPTLRAVHADPTAALRNR